jgi:hypothetical protein
MRSILTDANASRRALVLLSLLAVLPYLNALRAGFAFDDERVIQRNPVARDDVDLTLTRSTVRSAPQSAKAHFNLGIALQHRRADNGALAEFQRTQGILSPMTGARRTPDALSENCIRC